MKIIAVIFFYFSHSCLIAQETNPVLNYEQRFFDSDTCCWRKLADNKEYEKGANLIVSYLKNNNTHTNKHSLYWHAGQMFAKAQQDQKAICYFRKTYNFLYRWFGGEDGKTWYFYAKGTVAFIKRDKEKLHKMIEIWNKGFPKDGNYDSLIQLYKNWDKNYLEITEH